MKRVFARSRPAGLLRVFYAPLKVGFPGTTENRLRVVCHEPQGISPGSAKLTPGLPGAGNPAQKPHSRIAIRIIEYFLGGANMAFIGGV